MPKEAYEDVDYFEILWLFLIVQQSSFYGYTSMLPSRYTQAVMAGESGAGLLVSVNRIVTKLLLQDQRVNTLVFFSLSVIIVGLCFALHQIVRQTDFVQFYLTLCKESKKITLEPTEDAGLMDAGDNNEGKNSQYGVLKLQPQSPLDATQTSGHFSFSNPVYEPSSSGGPTYKVEDVVVRMSGNTSTYRKTGTVNPWAAVQKGITARWEVAQNIWHYMLTICLVYLVTLSLYPGIESEIISCKFGTWMPVILMAAFNASDLIGKMIAILVYDWSRTKLLVLTIGRIVMIPSLLVCATPREHPITSGEAYPLFISIMLGITNGIIGSVPMIQAPSRVSEQYRELTGNIMTLSYNVGLTAGSLLAYVFEAMLGPPVPDPCAHQHPFPASNVSIFHPSIVNNFTTTTLTTIVSAISTTAATTPFSVSSPTQLSFNTNAMSSTYIPAVNSTL